MNKYEVVIIGGGAAGLMTAITAASNGRKVALLEGNKQLGKKILISGGGRCNFTNTDAGPQNFVSQNKHYFKSALKKYSPWEFVDLVEKYNISYFEKQLGQLFCKNSARDIVAMFEKECAKHGVDIFFSTKVISVEKEGYKFICKSNNETFESDKLVIATGGLAIPSIGATDFGLKVGKSFGHKLIETRPALVPFTLNDDVLNEHSLLSGIALPVRISNHAISFDEDILFTHKGLSGPATLQISLHWKPQEEISINFLPNDNVEEILANAKKKRPNQMISKILKDKLPSKFLDKWCDEYLDDSQKYIGNVKNDEIHKFSEKINNWTIIPTGTEGYRKAEVTIGGVSTDDISSKTMESKKMPGLYFVGEVVDVTGWLGGYNFQWAWASGHAAGESL